MTTRDLILQLLEARSVDVSICPSDVARFLASLEGRTARGWRDKMAEVHATVDELLSEGSIKITWKGEALRTRSGPYRIRRSRR